MVRNRIVVRKQNVLSKIVLISLVETSDCFSLSVG